MSRVSNEAHCQTQRRTIALELPSCACIWRARAGPSLSLSRRWPRVIVGGWPVMAGANGPRARRLSSAPSKGHSSKRLRPPLICHSPRLLGAASSGVGGPSEGNDVVCHQRPLWVVMQTSHWKQNEPKNRKKKKICGSSLAPVAHLTNRRGVSDVSKMDRDRWSDGAMEHFQMFRRKSPNKYKGQ